MKTLLSLVCALVAGAIALPVAHAATAAERYAAGEIHRTIREASAAARNRGDDSLRITIWYPADPAADEKPVTVGAPDDPVFITGRVATDARWGAGPARPLILVSHGFGGSARQMMWLGSSLARSGYVVVAVDHPGTNGIDGVTAQGAYATWERAGDIEAALDFVLADPSLGPRVDAARIGMAGFSLGGWTAALLAGARTDFEHLDRFCASPQRDSICEPQREFPLDFSQRRVTLAADAMRELAAREHRSFRDARVRAVFMIAPALAQAIDPASLAAIAIPVAVVVGSADPVTIPKTNAEVFARAIRDATLTVLPNVAHYDFLSECGAAGARVAAAYCTDGVGTARAATHAFVIDEARQFFDATLR